MTTWYVRPDASHSGIRNGTSFDNAWGGWAEIIWGASGVKAGDILYVCGAHAYTASIAVGTHGATSEATRVTIRGDYAILGTISFSSTGFFDAGRNYTTLKSVTITSAAPGYNCIYLSAKTGFVVDRCTLIGGMGGVTLASNVAFTSCSITNNTIYGQSIAGINQSIATASIISAGITVAGNTVHDTSLYGIQLSIASTNLAWTTSSFSGYTIWNNTVYNTPGAAIYLRTCHNDLTTYPSIYSPGLTISGNTVRDCGTMAGPDGHHGGLLVMGFGAPLIANNTVRNCYVTGAGIQTAKNISPQILFNTISGIRSGTPAEEYQNGFPIDGNGIFFDNLTIGGLAFGNHISDLISTGDPNSGAGLAFWTAIGSTYAGNIVVNCNRGVFYGRAEETGNVVRNNTFINCNAGIWKAGTSVLAGNITVKNNILHNCAVGFSLGANPSVTADYNCIYGAVTPYVDIPAGSNDLSIDPLLDASYRPRAAALKRGGIYLGGKDFYGKQFYNPPNIGAVDDLPATPRYLLTGPKNPNSAIR